MNKWNWSVIDGEVFIVCDGKKIAKMLPDEVGQQAMIDNASLIKVVVNNHFELKEEVSKP
jgi:hypothetical protein